MTGILKPLFVLSLLLLALMEGLRADGGVNTKGWTGEKIKPTWETNQTNDIPQQRYDWGSDAPAGHLDQFNATRSRRESGEPALAIWHSRPCENDDLLMRVTYRQQPMKGANVALYRQGGGRALVSETTSDAEGFVVFSRKALGRYDVVAAREGYPPGQAMLTIGSCPLIEPAAPAGVSEESARPRPMVQNYEAGASRLLQPIILADGREATRVVVRLIPGEDYENATLIERIPSSLAIGRQAIGFERDYPDFISDSDPLTLRWRLARLAAGRPVERAFVILRPVNSAMAGTYASPMLVDGLDRVQVPSRLSGSRPPGGAINQTNSTPVAAAMMGPLNLGMEGVLLLLGIGLFIGALVAAYRFGRRMQEEEHLENADAGARRAETPVEKPPASAEAPDEPGV